MEVRVLGSIEVVVGGRAVDIGGPKQRRLLALLVVHANRLVSADRLIDGLWGEQPPKRGRELQVLVSNLRRVLEPDRPVRTPAQVLVTRPPGYVLVVDESQLDSVRFEALLASGQQLLGARGRTTPAPPSIRRSSCGGGRRWPSSPTTTSPAPRRPASSNCTPPPWRNASRPTSTSVATAPPSPTSSAWSTSTRSGNACGGC